MNDWRADLRVVAHDLEMDRRRRQRIRQLRRDHHCEKCGNQRARIVENARGKMKRLCAICSQAFTGSQSQTQLVR